VAEERTEVPRPEVLAPYFVVETPTEGGPGVYTDGQHKREAVRTLFAVAELQDVERATLWRTLGPRGLIVQALAVAFLNNAGLFEAVGAMMQLLENDNERKKRVG
jgi:hypothetical protein